MKKIVLVGMGLFIGSSFLLLSFQKSIKHQWLDQLKDTNTHIHDASEALKGLEIHPDLEVSVFATEPMLKNPTNMEIDSKGRVWVLEAYNYRPDINGNPTNPKGDRILILEDTNHDGVADKQTVFYQSPELASPLGICVLDNMVIVSQSPYIWKMYDDDGDDKMDRKELFFQGMSGEQHDHGVHAFSFGPDGKLYFNFGNEGNQLLDGKGRPVLDQDGDPIGPNKYRQGMVFRCDLDGGNVEVLGHNFRNNYEIAVDSYGALWQSDNDDDGNKGVRINAVFEHGNYGYTDEMTGAGWYIERTNWEETVPQRHWHLNDPGVVPNLLQTGAGSPTGMIVYEGDLLPKEFHGQMIHTDAGPNVVRSYPRKDAGAGYTASITNILKGVKDQWFRPSDVTQAPDGSIFVSDWYDPGVGGHQAGDQVKGRIYRIAPKGNAYSVPKFDLSSIGGALDALNSPNLARRYLGFERLLEMGPQARLALENQFRKDENPIHQARAFWVLNLMTDSFQYTQEASKSNNHEIRMMAIRAMKRHPFGKWYQLAQEMAKDENPQVRRELAIALRHESDPDADKIWANLALQYDGLDRWYLEALGIGADGNWDLRFTAFESLQKDRQSKNFRDIVWRSRGEGSLEYLFSFIKENKPLKEKLRYFRALDFVESKKKTPELLTLISHEFKNDLESQLLSLHHMDPDYFRENPMAHKVLVSLIAKTSGDQYLNLVSKYGLNSELENLYAIILKGDNSAQKVGQVIYGLEGGAAFLKGKFDKEEDQEKIKILNGIKRVGSDASLGLINAVMMDAGNSPLVRKEAGRRLGNNGKGEEYVLELLRANKVPKDFIPAVVESVQGAWRKAIRMEANSYLGETVNELKTNYPSVAELVKMNGKTELGMKIFVDQCAVCHQVNGVGVDFGPKLSEIGDKLSREGLYLSILKPSAGIGFGYESFEVRTKKGEVYNGIIASKTETDIVMKFPGGGDQHIKTSAVETIKQLEESMMPEGFDLSLKPEEMAHLVSYLEGLRKKN